MSSATQIALDAKPKRTYQPRLPKNPKPRALRMLDLFAGRFDWGSVFAERGWEVIGVDALWQEPPIGCKFVQSDISTWNPEDIERLGPIDFICASPPCEHNFGLTLFQHTRALCELSGLPYVIKSVRRARQVEGPPVNHCGPVYLWGNAVPFRLPKRVNGSGAVPRELAMCVAAYAEQISLECAGL